MTTATYVLEIDWTGAGDYSGANDDVTSDLFFVECKRGRDYASQLTGKAVAGRLIAKLDNTDGKYSPLNSSSALFGNLIPGRKVRLRTTLPTATNLWTGFLSLITPGASYDEYPVVYVEAVGGLEKLNGKQITPIAQASQTTGIIVGAILDASGWPLADRSIDTGQTTIERWFADRKEALNSVKEIEETELGFLFEDENGNLVYEDRHNRLKGDKLISQATFADDGTGDCGYHKIEQQDPIREIFNEVIATVSPYEAAVSNAVLWTLREDNPAIGSGETVTWWAQYPNDEVGIENGAYVETWATPVVGTDITQTGVDNADISVSVSKFANSMKIEITNNGTAAATITLLQAQGIAVTKKGAIRIIAEDITSQEKYGERTFRLPGIWLPDTNTARDFVNYLIGRYKDPLPVVNLGFIANTSSDHMTQALTRKISDRITVKATGGKTKLGIDADFFIETISHRITEAGLRHEVTFNLSEATGDGGYWVVGSSLLGTETKLAY